jgi:spore maturation protein SpmB
VNIRRIRHALAAGLTADIAGVAAAVAICAILFA